MKNDGKLPRDGDASFLKPTFLASLRPQAFSVEKPMFLVSKVVAAS